MKIVEYFESDAGVQRHLLQELGRCDWRAGKYLRRMLAEQMFIPMLGSTGKVFFLLDNDTVVSFLTFTPQDSVIEPDLTPWIGFVFTFPEYRGHRHLGRLLDHVRKCAAANGAPFVFLLTPHNGLYEKYGFSYWGIRRGVDGADCRMYYAPAADITVVAENMQSRAREVVRRSAVREAWKSLGAKVNPVGSLATGLLIKHRDIDFHIYADTLDPAKSREVVAHLCADPHIKLLSYRDLAATEEACLEWHLRYDLDGEAWRIDLIQIRQGSRFDGHFEHIAERIKAVLTPETRRAILELKFLTPEYEHIAGIEYCHAVLADGVRTYGEFSAWRKNHPMTGIDLWCP